jgi:hypothetical protein
LDIVNFGEKTLEEVYLALEKEGFVRESRQHTVDQERKEAERQEKFNRNTRRRLPNF